MSGSTFGNQFKITTWGESHGAAVGVVIDGCPAGLSLSEEDIQGFLNRRKPGTSKYATPRQESDLVEICSGTFEGRTTGTPISMIVRNESQRSRDYSEIASYYRPGHADYTFDAKYGFRDYRGGGRSSGRETIGRVAAGAVASKILSELSIHVCAYTSSIGPIGIDTEHFDLQERDRNVLCMPDAAAFIKASEYLDTCMKAGNSSGGMIECRINGMPAGIGDPVFEKLDANLAKAIMSIGAVKSFEIGSGCQAAAMTGLEHNDAFVMQNQKITKKTNHAGGILGGISDGDEILFKCAIKPTPSVSSLQHTVNQNGKNIEISIKGRHDPVIVPRAVVVVESMAAVTLVDMLFSNMSTRMDAVRDFYKR